MLIQDPGGGNTDDLEEDSKREKREESPQPTSPHKSPQTTNCKCPLSGTPMSATHGWNKAMQRHARPHSAATHFRPSVVLQHKWGKVASCNKKGNEVSIMLANNTQG